VKESDLLINSLPLNKIKTEENLLKPVSLKDVRAIQCYLVPKYNIDKESVDNSEYHVDLMGIEIDLLKKFVQSLSKI
jgi:hypothetical protein